MENHDSAAQFCWTILYQGEEGVSFDFETFSKNLIPEYADILGDNCLKYEVRRGLAAPGASAPRFICITNFWIKSRERFRESMSDERMKELMIRISTITELKPIRQMDEILA